MTGHAHLRSFLHAGASLALLAAAAPAAAQQVIPASDANWIREANQADAGFGRHVAGAGDVDGDGFGDLLVGSSGFDGAFPDSGRIFLYKGGPSGPSAVPSWSFDGDRQGAFLSRALGVGDINGDGFDDVVVADPEHSDQLTGRGRLLVFHGSASGLSVAPDASILMDRAGGALGTRLAAGDVDGDGFNDVVSLSSTVMQMFPGSTVGLASAPAATMTDSPASEFAGGPAVGDVTGDGFDDVAFTTFDAVKGSFVGRLRLHRGSAAGLETKEARSITVDLSGGNLLAVVGFAGDVDGDAFGDLAMSTLGTISPAAGPPEHVVLHRGARSGFRPRGDVAHEAPHGALAAEQVGTAGDIDGDGFDDLIVPERPSNASGIPMGRVLVFAGSASGLGAMPAIIIEHELPEGGFGLAAGSAGDVNGDGLDDLIVGAPFFSGGESNEGRVYLFFGRQGF